MPPELAETCIKAGSPRGGIVFDPFNGAGTTGLVAARLGRRYVGADLSREYLEMAEARIAAGLRPVSKLDAPRPVVPMPGQMSFLGEGA
jgi:DNA modification methylase